MNNKHGAISRIRLAAASAALVFASAPAQAQTLTTLASFDGTNGGYAMAPLVQATNGKLYGTTSQGGASSDGNVFEITPSGTLTTLYSFCSQTNCADGADPESGLVQATNGKLYGTTSIGGNTDGGQISPRGTVFEITLSGRMMQLYSFPLSDGNLPIAGLMQAGSGDLYGTTISGGDPNELGTIFKISPSGKLTTIYSFCSQPSCADGNIPYQALIQAANGDLYGTTFYGGAHSAGTVFKVGTGGELTTLHSFCSRLSHENICLDGQYPVSGLVEAVNGNFYGTTYNGGANGTACTDDCGTLFEITPAGKLTTLYSFCSKSACADGNSPYGTLIQATDGNFYGTTTSGGNTTGGVPGWGTAFQINASGALTTLYTFCTQSNCADGATPFAGLVQDTNGNLYGTTSSGGVNLCPKQGGTCGTVFSLSVGLAPFVKTLPTSGAAGLAVKILGTDLTTASRVTFNGTPAVFTVVSSSEIATIVPSGASTGNVQVTTHGGTLTSNVPFRVTP